MNEDVMTTHWLDTPDVQSFRSLIVQRLTKGFAELDAQTSSVETRQKLYATLVHEAICMARQRLPENQFLEELVQNSHSVEAANGGTVILI